MTSRIVIFGGTDWSDGQVLYASELNGAFNSIDTKRNNFILGNMLSMIRDNSSLTLTNQKQFQQDLFDTDTATMTQFMIYDSGNKYYKCIDTTNMYYVIIAATSLTMSNFAINTCLCKQFGSGKWILYATAGTYEVNRANVMKTLFYGTNGSDPKVTGITGLTALKSADSRDIGKRAHYATCTSGTVAYPNTNNEDITGTFADTTTNNNCSTWSYLNTHTSGVATPSFTASWEIPSGTAKNSYTGASTVTQDYTGLDKTADQINNPATCKLKSNASQTAGAGTCDDTIRALILCVGSISWSQGASQGTYSTTNFNSSGIPDFTTVTESLYVSYIIGTSLTIANTAEWILLQAEYAIDATSSFQAYASFDNQANWTLITKDVINRILNAGTTAYIKLQVTRTDLTKIDNITGYRYFIGP